MATADPRIPAAGQRIPQARPASAGDRPASDGIGSNKIGARPAALTTSGRHRPGQGRAGRGGAATRRRHEPGSIAAHLRALERQGYRATPQRLAILQSLLSTGRINVPAEDVCRRARVLCPTVNLATTYRTLELLGRLGIVRRLTYGDGRAVFCANPQPHYHGTCLRCGAVVDLPQGRVAEVLEREQTGLTDPAFGVVSHRVEFYGYCASCRDVTGADRSPGGGQAGRG
ncbi:MAG TPA: Fur family transcriptional regulator [bacterium]|nr:Fur family transcriptional regulator [bacterium]